MSAFGGKAVIGKPFPNALLRLSCAFVSGAAMKRRDISLIGGAALSISDEDLRRQQNDFAATPLMQINMQSVSRF